MAGAAVGASVMAGAGVAVACGPQATKNMLSAMRTAANLNSLDFIFPPCKI
jgi:hypothetical protein